MQFQKDVYDFVVGRPPGIDGFQKVQRIHGLHQGDVWKHQLELVGLQMADKVPLHIGRHQRNLGCKLLRPAFGKNPLPRIVGLTQPFDRMELGHSNKRHPLWK